MPSPSLARVVVVVLQANALDRSEHRRQADQQRGHIQLVGDLKAGIPRVASNRVDQIDAALGDDGRLAPVPPCETGVERHGAAVAFGETHDFLIVVNGTGIHAAASIYVSDGIGKDCPHVTGALWQRPFLRVTGGHHAGHFR
ncbi:hypothetical protein [Thiorhodococcus drewsii]|uniref:hypothetical protein n=1 Tax=Thiorhodococcus drewsii TaxID=210408 RepID=UPI0005926CEC|nr:hypothetical protein [Thiorhodococcus drewsii]